MQALPLEAATTIAVEVDHAGHEFGGSNEGLVITALQFQLLLVLDLDVGSFNLQSSRLEHLGSLIIYVLPSC